MWDYVPHAPLPMYTSYRNKRKESKADMTVPPPIPTTPAQETSNIAPELLEPAIDAPPSPERLRQLSRQMRGSVFRSSGHHPQPSSGASSLRSFNSVDKSSWEQTLDGISLSRRSSGRSTSSSMPSRERPDSVQFFSKAIFNRRGKLKRDSKSSSGSSLYSAEIPYELPAPTSNSKDSFIPVVLRRRRRATTMKEGGADPTSARQKKIQISEPYNFQHVTHAQRDNMPDLEQSTRMDLAAEFAAVRSSQMPTHGSLKGIQADDLHFANFSSEALPLSPESPVEPHARISVSRPPMLRSQTSPPRRLANRSQSQEQLRIPPPRPPRSPIQSPLASPPIPPPRVSSRATMQYGDYDPMATTSLERPSTSTSFRQPQPFSPSFEHLAMDSPGTASGLMTPADDMEEYFDPRFSHAITTPDDAAWPLSASSTLSALPDVPEEDENYTVSRRSRVSVASNSSSLRASQSVPALRTHARAPSDGSDVLGQGDTSKRSLKTAMASKDDQSLAKDNWEDVIDYCYDHEAEADFDYEWERPSIDMSRDTDSCTPVESAHSAASPYLSTPSQFDIPALSPASQTSNADPYEALTPTVALTQSPSNFSLPRLGKPDRVSHTRTPSYASSFKESHGFTLSPSLLIPNDFHQQMLLARNESNMYPEEEWIQAQVDTAYLTEPQTSLDPDMLRSQLRSSISTIATESSVPSDMSADRHTSTSTACSRFTVSSNSEDAPPKPESVAEKVDCAPNPIDINDVTSSLEDPSPSAMSTRREHSRGMSVPITPSTKVKDDDASAKETIVTRRQRSRTASSINAAPIYGLFPAVYRRGA